MNQQNQRNQDQADDGLVTQDGLRGTWTFFTCCNKKSDTSAGPSFCPTHGGEKKHDVPQPVKAHDL